MVCPPPTSNYYSVFLVITDAAEVTLVVLTVITDAAEVTLVVLTVITYVIEF